jgi:hypothetical protein
MRESKAQLTILPALVEFLALFSPGERTHDVNVDGILKEREQDQPEHESRCWSVENETLTLSNITPPTSLIGAWISFPFSPIFLLFSPSAVGRGHGSFSFSIVETVRSPAPGTWIRAPWAGKFVPRR